MFLKRIFEAVRPVCGGITLQTGRFLMDFFRTCHYNIGRVKIGEAAAYSCRCNTFRQVAQRPDGEQRRCVTEGICGTI